MNMKKRSQSSLRSKTLQSEQDYGEGEAGYWMGNLKKMPSRNQKITASMMDCNKQNNQVNIIPVYQSITESVSVNRTPTSFKSQRDSQCSVLQNHECAFKQRCKRLQKEMTMLYAQRNQLNNSPVERLKASSHSSSLTDRDVPELNNKKTYNYVEKYYIEEIQRLKIQNSEMGEQIKKYRDLYSSKKDELDGLHFGVTQKIQKQHNEKNVLIKQINTNNIEIKRLKQEINLYKSEKQTLKIAIKQKQAVIEDLNSSILNVQIKRKKIQGYEMQLHESQVALRQIELQVVKYKNQAEKKDSIINGSNKKIGVLQGKLLQYQEDVKQLQKFVLSLKQISISSAQKVSEIQQQCQQWKQKYCEVKQQVEQVSQLQIKLKNTQLTIDDLQTRNKDLILQKQKLKIELSSGQNLKSKVYEQEKQILNLKNLLREKCEELQIYEANHLITKEDYQKLQNCKATITQLQKINQEKEQQLRILKAKFDEKQVKLNNLYQELEETAKQRTRIKELQVKIDALFSQNQNLHSSLLEKLKQIEQFQKKINFLQSKNNSFSNELSKLKAIHQGVCESLSESESKLQNMKNRWETQLGSKLSLQEKCTRLSKDLTILKTQVSTLEQNNLTLKQKSQQIVNQFEQQKYQLFQQLQQLQEYKIEAQNHLIISSTKTQQLKESVKSMKQQIAVQIHQQKDSHNKIQQLQNYIISLKETIKTLSHQSQKYKSFFTQINEMSGSALK